MAPTQAAPAPSRPITFLLREAHGGRVVAVLALMAAGSLTSGVGVLMLVPILARLGGAGEGWLQWVSDALGFVPSTPLLLGFVVLLTVLRAAIGYAQRIQSQVLQFEVVDGLRQRAFAGVLRAEWRWLVQSRASDHASLVLTQVARVGQGLNQLLAAALIALTMVGYGIAAMLLSWRLALFCAILGVLVMTAFRTQRRRASARGVALGVAGRVLHARVQQGFAGVRIGKAYGAVDRQIDEFAAATAAVRARDLQQEQTNELGQAALQVGGAAMLAVILAIGHLLWGIALPTLLPLLLVFSRLAPMLGALQASWLVWRYAQPAVVELETFLAQLAVEREPEAEPGARLLLTRAIELRDIAVRFAGRDAAAVEGITLTLPANTTTALCGASGAGKSTLADVLMALIVPDNGTLLVDGTPIEGAQRIAWRRSVAYVQQDAFLFHDTIHANIVLGRDGITTDAVEQALRRAGAEFVLCLPDGIETVVGDGGVRLSGGERQRVALARALIGDPALLILDEATSALDPETEQAVRRTMLALRGQVTMLFISHRESMRADADQVVMLDRGRLV